MDLMGKKEWKWQEEEKNVDGDQKV